MLLGRAVLLFKIEVDSCLLIVCVPKVHLKVHLQLM